jgi:hypothetical protein
LNPLPAPESDKLVEKEFVTDPWARYFNTHSEQLSRAALRLVAPISLTDQSASIASSAICPNQVASGLYRITYYVRVTTVGSVSSSIQVNFAWTDHGVAQTFSGTAVAGNTTTSWGSEDKTVYIDAQTAITYSTTYASNLAAEAKYQVYVMIEQVAI